MLGRAGPVLRDLKVTQFYEPSLKNKILPNTKSSTKVIIRIRIRREITVICEILKVGDTTNTTMFRKIT